MKVIIAGSRSVTDYSFVKQAVIDSGLWERYGRNIEVVCGMAKGVDMLGSEFAKNNNLKCHKFPADWDKYGKRAGALRNIQMGEFSDALIAVWDGKSRGTLHMWNWAVENGLFSYMYNVSTGTQIWMNYPFDMEDDL